MKTKAARPTPKEEPAVSNPASVAPESDVTRVSFPVGPDGNVVWDSIRTATKEKLRTIIQNPETSKALGIVDTTKPTVEVFDPEWTGSLYDAIGKLESFAAQKLYKISPDVAEKAFHFTDLEKDKLAGPTAKVINKYASTWMVQFKDEIALAFLFVTITAVKLQMAQALQRIETAQAQAQPQPPQPTRADLNPKTLEKSVQASDAPKPPETPAS